MIEMKYPIYRHKKAMRPRILDSQDIKSAFDSKMLNFNNNGFYQLLNMFGKFDDFFGHIRLLWCLYSRIFL